MRRAAAGLAMIMAAGSLSACAPPVTGPSLVLRLAWPDDTTDLITSMQIRHFAEQVNSLSQATIRIEPVPNADADALGWDQVVARGVADGRWELGLVPGRAWDVLGVSSLKALNAPFLVTGPAALEAVLNGGIRDDLLAGLPAAGVVGLDIFPDEMRHPFGYASPLLGVADYRQATIRSPRSATVAMLFDALGASVTDALPNSTDQRGTEAQFSTSAAGIATANVTFFPKTDVLVADSDVRHRLRPDQWALLRTAAAATRTWMFARQPSDLESAATFCGHHGRIVTATAEEKAGLEAAGAQVTAKLRQDAGTRRMIEKIRAVTTGLPAPDPVTRCPGTDGSADTAGDAEAAVLNGVYTADVTAQRLRDAGDHDEAEIRDNTGLFTWTLHSGTWTYHQQADVFIANADDTGRYTYSGGVFTLYWTAEPDNWTRSRVRVARNGTISFTDIVDGRSQAQALAEGLFSVPWTHVGKAPD